MLQRGFIKQDISISGIGAVKFWAGIIMGILMSFSLAYLLNYSREAFRMMPGMGDLHILPESKARLYDLFFSALSVSLGFGFTVSLWMSGRNRNIKKRYFQTFAATMPWYTVFVVLIVLARIGSLVAWTLFNNKSYDNHLDFIETYGIMFILLPVCIFLSHWNTLMRLFRIKYWGAVSLLIGGLLTLMIHHTAVVDREAQNHVHYLQNKEAFDFIDSEFEAAKEYGIYLDDSLKDILRKKNSEKSRQLVIDCKKAFTRNERVPLDTLILQRIMVHNRKMGWYHDVVSGGRRWSYVEPEEVYFEVLKYKPGDKEVGILFGILAEELKLVRDEMEMRKGGLMDEGMNIGISGIILVVHEFKSNPKYAEQHHLLPPYYEMEVSPFLTLEGLEEP